MPDLAPTHDPFAEIYDRAAGSLAELLPSEILAACDRLLGEGATSRERWALYDTTYSHLQHTAKNIRSNDDHRQPYLLGANPPAARPQP